MSDQVTIEDVWRTDAGAQLFNGLTRMHLVHVDGRHVYFSERRRIVDRFIGMLLEGGLIPQDLTPVIWKQSVEQMAPWRYGRDE